MSIYLIAELPLTTLIAIIGSLIICIVFVLVLLHPFGTPKVSELNCSYCGTKNETDVIFCKKCGKKLS